MKAIEELSDEQLIKLSFSKRQLDVELRKEIAEQIEKRGLQILKEENIEEGLSIHQRLFYLIPIPIITMPLAAKFLGIGEKKKYKQAWQMIIIGLVIAMLAFIMILR